MESEKRSWQVLIFVILFLIFDSCFFGVLYLIPAHNYLTIA